jgi:hypothetical protein
MKYILTAMFLAAASMAVAGTPVKNPAPVAPAPAPACDPLNYSYAELGWIHKDNNIGKADGAYLDLSYALGSNFLLEATGTLADGDFEYSEFGAGVGYIVPVNDKVHFIVRGGWAQFDDNLGAAVNELYIAPGVRIQVTCKFELYAKAYFHFPEGGEDNFSWGAGALYHLCPRSALVVGGAWGEDDAWSIQAGVRWKL